MANDRLSALPEEILVKIFLLLRPHKDDCSDADPQQQWGHPRHDPDNPTGSSRDAHALLCCSRALHAASLPLITHAHVRLRHFQSALVALHQQLLRFPSGATLCTLRLDASAASRQLLRSFLELTDDEACAKVLLAGVTELALLGPRRLDHETLSAFLGRLPALHRLTLCGSCLGPSSYSGIPPPSPPPSPSASAHAHTDPSPALQPFSHLPSLRHLRLDRISFSDTAALASVTCVTSLHSLVISTGYLGAWRGDPLPLLGGLHQLQHLEHLELDLCPNGKTTGPKEGPTDWACVSLAFFSALASLPRLRHVSSNLVWTDLVPEHLVPLCGAGPSGSGTTGGSNSQLASLHLPCATARQEALALLATLPCLEDLELWAAAPTREVQDRPGGCVGGSGAGARQGQVLGGWRVLSLGVSLGPWELSWLPLGRLERLTVRGGRDGGGEGGVVTWRLGTRETSEQGLRAVGCAAATLARCWQSSGNSSSSSGGRGVAGAESAWLGREAGGSALPGGGECTRAGARARACVGAAERVVGVLCCELSACLTVSEAERVLSELRPLCRACVRFVLLDRQVEGVVRRFVAQNSGWTVTKAGPLGKNGA